MIDLRSDTVTTPDERMREAARTADVGDDVYGEDPTVNDLEERAAAAVGMDAALYVPSGTMGNQIAARVHTERGQELLADRKSHVVKYELGGLAQHAGLQLRTFETARGVPSPAQVDDEYVAADLHRPETGLLWLENTHNARGGLAIAPDRIAGAADAAHERGVPVHVDGARLFNAATALDVSATDLTEPVDSVMFCLSKGLGAPVGSILAGSEAFVERARRTRKLFGGGMRQAGLIAAPGLCALENVSELETDHEHARLLADGLADVEGVDIQAPETNIVLVDVAGAELESEAVLERLHERGVAASALDATTIRFCTHRDISRADLENAVDAVCTAFDTV
ncbi:threonine aldolase family protein [Natronorubrum bangense]|uniref:Threonine aldolase n=2 Tax=Natronorubrum bangense TaxID=61858 RepID=L9WQY4_9EURY|nr:GntG family PLP-dependent aldolase [Natronorubrum bangense]ELY50738.1 threonine aldolase [Natronorubrum bangense JCM 10635]QCC54372.1 low specificity L-threonine aldolase [Natronorubrum bangense]